MQVDMYMHGRSMHVAMGTIVPREIVLVPQ